MRNHFIPGVGELGVLPAGSLTSLALDGSGDKIGTTFHVETADAITHVGYRQASSAGTPPTYKISLQSVSSGDPSGTVLGGGSPASATFTPTSATDGEWVWIALDNSYTPSNIGELIAVVLEYSTGTIDGSNNITATYATNNTSTSLIFPPAMINTAVWAKYAAGLPIFGYRTASSRYGRPIQNFSMEAVATSGHRLATGFTFSANGVTSFTLSGFWIVVDMPAAGTVTFGIWNTAGTALATGTLTPSDVQSAVVDKFVYVGMTSTPSLTPGTKYYIGAQADGNTFEIAHVTVQEASDFLAWTPHAVVQGSWDTASWTDTATICPVVFPVINSVTPEVGGTPGALMLLGVGG